MPPIATRLGSAPSLRTAAGITSLITYRPQAPPRRSCPIGVVAAIRKHDGGRPAPEAGERREERAVDVRLRPAALSVQEDEQRWPRRHPSGGDYYLRQRASNEPAVYPVSGDARPVGCVVTGVERGPAAPRGARQHERDREREGT